MQLECHLAVGWLMGNLVPGADRRFRALAVFAALAPDLDGLPYLFGPDAYAASHHVYGHNVFFALLVTICCAALVKPPWRMKMAIVAGLAVGSHWVTDYYLSGWPLMTFWPISRDEVMFRPRIGLDHPINQALGYATLLFFLASPLLWRRTILELFWPAMDRLLVGLMRPREFTCAICARSTAQSCATCGKALCLRHGKITRRLVVSCADCAITK